MFSCVLNKSFFLLLLNENTLQKGNYTIVLYLMFSCREIGWLISFVYSFGQLARQCC